MAVMIACFLSGVAFDWWLREVGPPLPAAALLRYKGVVEAGPSDGSTRTSAPDRTPVIKAPGQTPAEEERADPIEELRRRGLRMPIDGAVVDSMKGDFAELRSGTRPHEAIDILAPRFTPIHAVENGTIEKLFVSKAGGNTIYHFDPARRFAYYYAHIDRYAEGLKEGQPVARGDVIAYVGTSGNAPPNTPHLHFAIFVLTTDRQWWKGAAIDPYLVFGRD